MTIHYVYVDSIEKKTNEKINDFTVHLHAPLKNVIRCGVWNFSKGNNSFNVHPANNTVEWVERFFSATSTVVRSRPFSITLEPKYYNINQLLTEITNKMNATPNRQVASEGTVTYTYKIDEDYRVSIIGTSANSAASNRHWGF